MLLILLRKDLRRIWRNPIPVVVMLAVPLMISSMIGLAFGGASRGSGFGQIKIAIVDEDQSVLSEFMRGAVGQEEFAENIDAQFMERAAALQLVTAGDISAVVVIPANFTHDYLTGQPDIPSLEVIKNPAQGMYPAIIEEGLSSVVSVLNAAARIIGEDLRTWSTLFDDDEETKFSLLAAGTLLIQTDDRLEAAKDYLFPPLLSYTKATRNSGEQDDKPSISVFGYVLIGMTSMFLLYLADNGMRDLYREMRFHTLERYRTANENLLAFVIGKILVSFTVLTLGAILLLGTGALMFGFPWQHPLHMLALVMSYSVCAAGLMGLMAAIAGKEKRADILNNIFVLILAMLGGSMFPTENMPAVVHQIAAFFPPTWFNQTMRALQWSDPDTAWLIASAKLLLTGLVCAIGATLLFRRRLAKGVRA